MFSYRLFRVPTIFLVNHCICILLSVGYSTLDPTSTLTYFQKWMLEAGVNENETLNDLSGETVKRVAKAALNFAQKDVMDAKRDVMDAKRDVMDAKRDVIDAKKDAVNFQKQYEDEREMKLICQALIDVAETLKRLFTDCWPDWAGVPKLDEKERSHSLMSWTILLLNVENPVIYKLRCLLQSHGLSVKTFVNKIRWFEVLRHGEAHALMPKKTKDEGYAYLEEFVSNHNLKEEKTALVIFISVMDLLRKPREIALPSSSDTEVVNNSVSAERAHYNVLHFTNGWKDFDEIDLKNTFEEASVEGIGSPVAYLITEHAPGWFIMFDSFQDAYSAWCHRDKMNFDNTIKNAIVIRNLLEKPLWDGPFHIKITLNNMTSEEFVNQIPNRAENIKSPNPDKSNPELFLKYPECESMVLDYYQLKNWFPTGKVQLSKIQNKQHMYPVVKSTVEATNINVGDNFTDTAKLDQ